MESIVNGLKTIDQKLIKSSKIRLVIAGDFFELYSYDQPYHYNWPPCPRPFRGQIEDKVIIESEEQGRRESNLHACRQRIRRLVQANAGKYGQISKFITFTFKENETNISRANAEFRKFTKRLNYDWKIKVKYLAVVEFQKRGAIHYHVVYFNIPYIKDIAPKIEKIWGHGSVDVKAVAHVQNIGSYITKYLQKEVFDRRLAREKAFFCSKSLFQPFELKNPLHVAKFLDTCILETVATKTYRSTYYGDIIYSTGNLIKTNT